VAVRHPVKLTANFERNLEEVEQFLTAAGAPQAFDALLDELTDTVIPNLERFPDMGRLLMDRQAPSVEVRNGVESLKRKLNVIGSGGEVREYVLAQFLLLYARVDTTIYLLAVRHHRQLSFDFEALWAG
jgi:plasmid stabilization system protein ParE